MNRSALYLVIGALAAIGVVLGYEVYGQRQKAAGIEIDVGKNSISIQKK